jgi:hypothetical protein
MRPLIFGILLCLFPLFSYAQIGTGGFLNTTLSIELEPAYPLPGEPFTARLNDYGGEAYGATINWYYEDILLDGFSNNRSITVAAPTAGSSLEIKAVLQKPSGGIVVVSNTITPFNLDIIIEPQTHVPSFFVGRALPSAGSMVNATALISGETLLSGDYLYTWRINNTVIQGGALRGGDFVSFTMPQDSYPVLSLTVTRLDGSVIAKRAISLPSVAPKLLFYEVSTLYGMSETTLKSPFPFLSNSATLRAEPYYLDSEVFNNPTVAEWYIDGAKVGTNNNPYDITLERTGESRQSELTFRVQSTTKLLQGTKASVILDVI